MEKKQTEREKERKKDKKTNHPVTCSSAVSMNWLDSNYPTDADASKPGVARGRCDPTAGDPKNVEAQHPDASVVYSNIKLGALNSTFAAK